ncbi:MAG: hypothetical protein ACXAE3_06095 [Candidatus Kariarchaeaceae archaeon]
MAYKIGLFIRNYMPGHNRITAELIIKKQAEVFENRPFADPFETIISLFMLSRYGYLDHIDRDQGYKITSNLMDEFPPIDSWLENHEDYLSLLDRLDCKEHWLDILFRQNTWVNEGKLIELDLRNLLISQLDVDVLTGFPSLKKLYLYRNLLGTLPSGIFDCLPNLEKLDLSSNMINELPIDLFSSNPKLRSINLGENGVDHRWLKKFRILNRLTHQKIEIVI